MRWNCCLPPRPRDLDLGRFAGAILAGSVHIGRFQEALSTFAHARAPELGAMPTLLLCVSLSAAGHDAEDWAGLEKVLERFRAVTGWTPGQVLHVAGAFRFSQYDPFRGWAMRRVAAAKAPGVDPRQDREYTDWPALEAALADWVAALAKG